MVLSCKGREPSGEQERERVCASGWNALGLGRLLKEKQWWDVGAGECG